MEAQFWIDRWAAGNIGFHRPDYNEYLQQFWSQIGVDASAKVFVPLCGKSLDLNWLAEQGHAVIGNEVAEQAVEDFFRDAELEAKREKSERYQGFSHGDIRILCGDYFALTEEDLDGATAWYDRAAQVALPPEMREAYYDQLAELLPVGAIGLSLSFEYPQEQKSGPPFSVEEDEIQRLCHGRFSVELLDRMDRLSLEPRLVEQGLTRADEAIYRLVRI
ncbi:MAG: thiopurine S-methyltransferase [Planctomycetes bacterium]|nr:thiopurine S-methyltransferase [Planctomycetota bacterium]MCP4771498.1 thiopurine S-methyltransferase [Planctomycetota bacterium]MCP4861159.1 thiopurine S-methyltransferase [Planctomycetota bacterium]